MAGRKPKPTALKKLEGKPQMENVIFSLLEQWKKENEKENT